DIRTPAPPSLHHNQTLCPGEETSLPGANLTLGSLSAQGLSVRRWAVRGANAWQPTPHAQRSTPNAGGPRHASHSFASSAGRPAAARWRSLAHLLLARSKSHDCHYY